MNSVGLNVVKTTLIIDTMSTYKVVAFPPPSPTPSLMPTPTSLIRQGFGCIDIIKYYNNSQ